MNRASRRLSLSVVALLAMTLHAAAASTSPAGRWLAEDIGGGGVIDRLQSVLEIAADGRISGTGGCNRIAGKARVEGIRISFGPIVSTRMACSPAVMDQERKFLAALEKVRRWHVDPARGKLALLGARGKPLIVFSRM